MCDEESNNIGDPVPPDHVLYRACTKSKFLSATKNSVEPIAFQKQGKNHKDGLSLALSANACAKSFPNNKGVIRITVQEILSIERDLEVRFDLLDRNHVLIRRLPCMDREIEERSLAEAVASELSNLAKVEHPERLTPVPDKP
jgi:hypothetical protein